MGAESRSPYPSRPPSIAEWEDLLVRLEVMPRALRNVLEEAPADDPEVLGALRGLAEGERRAHAWFRALQREPAPAEPGTPPEPRALAELFTRLRARTFAMMQRRGLEVWEWEAELPGEGTVSSYQLLCALVAHDVAALARLRAARRPEATAC